MGIDISTDMVSIARRNHPELDFLITDVRKLNIGKSFHLAVCAFDSLNYMLSERDLHDALQAIGNHLLPGGRLLFDINSPALYADQPSGTLHRQVGDASFEQTWKYDHATETCRTTFTFTNGDTEDHLQRAYTTKDVNQAIAGTAMEITREFIDETFCAPPENSRKVFFLAERKNV